MHRIVIVLATLALSFAPAGLAQAQIGGPHAPTPLTQPPPPPPINNDTGDKGLSTLQQVLIFGSAALVLAAIAFVIVRDARRRAPVEKRPHKSGSPGHGAKTAATGGAPADTSASAVRARERQRAKRAKAKARAVRQQRKRNRPR
jgi:hypothetical protein